MKNDTDLFKNFAEDFFGLQITRPEYHYIDEDYLDRYMALYNKILENKVTWIYVDRR